MRITPAAGPRYVLIASALCAVLLANSCIAPAPASSPGVAPMAIGAAFAANTVAATVAPSSPAPVLKPMAPPAPATAASEAFVMDEASGAILYQRGAHALAAPASLTKIVTAVVALDHGHLDDWVTVDVDSRTMKDSTVMGLRPGDRFTLRDLLYGLMLPSGNDAALAIGRAVAGSDAAFVQEMNDTMSRLGLTDSHFTNPHGLTDPTHYTSAYDLAMVSRYAMTHPEFREIVDTVSYTAVGSRVIRLDSLISGMLTRVAGVDGVKSGFTEEAGRTLTISATRGGHRVYVVVLNDASREVDSANLLQWAFTNFAWSPPSDEHFAAALPTPAPADADAGATSVPVEDGSADGVVRAARTR